MKEETHWETWNWVPHQTDLDGPAFVIDNDEDIPAPRFVAKGDDRPLTFREAQIMAAAPRMLALLYRCRECFEYSICGTTRENMIRDIRALLTELKEPNSVDTQTMHPSVKKEQP